MFKKRYVVQTIVSTRNIQNEDNGKSTTNTRVLFNETVTVLHYWYEPLTFYKSTIRTLNKLLCNKKATRY